MFLPNTGSSGYVIIFSPKPTAMNRNLYFYLLLLVTVCMASCQQRLYFPDRANTPGLTHAMEGKATISLKPQANEYDSTKSESVNFGTGIDLAFSPIQHLGLIASYRWITDRRIEENQSYDLFSESKKTIGGVFNGKRWEIGAGYYDTFGTRGKVELYGGYGNGSLQRRGKELPEYDYDTRYHRFFLQPAAGFGLSKFFSFTGGIRFAFMKFYDFQSANPDLQYHIGKSKQDVTGTVFTFVEPFVNFEGGYKFLKGNIQVGASRQLIHTNIAGNLPVYISLGIVLHFDEAFFR